MIQFFFLAVSELIFPKTPLPFYYRFRAILAGKKLYSIDLSTGKRYFFSSSDEQARSKFTGHESEVTPLWRK